MTITAPGATRVPPGTTAAAYKAAVIASGPRLYFPLDDPVGVLSVHEQMAQRNGTPVGGIAFAQIDPWGTLGACAFNGTTGFIYEGTYNPVNTQPWSIECWYQSSKASATGLLNFGTPASTPLSGTFTPAVYLSAAGLLFGFASGGSVSTVNDAVATNDGQWHHAVLTYNGAGAMTLFRDGVQVASALSGVAPQVSTFFPQIGCSGNTGRGGWFQGNLAHVAHYTKALSADDVFAHFTAAPAPPVPTDFERQARLVLGGVTVPLDNPDGGWVCTELDLGFPDIRDVTDVNPIAHGVIDRTRYFGGRVITAQFTSWDGGDMPLDLITAQFAPFLDVGARPELHYTTKGNPIERVLTLRASAWSAPMDPPNYGQNGSGGNVFQASWIAADPIARGAVTQLATAWAGDSTTIGRVYPLTFPRQYATSGGSPSVAILKSPGSSPFRPMLRLYGPISAPVITLATQLSGQRFVIAGSLTSRIDAGHFVAIDCASQTAFLDGDPSQPWLSQLDWTRTTWPVLPVVPDQTTMSLTGNNTTGITQVQASWQDRYFL